MSETATKVVGPAREERPSEALAEYAGQTPMRPADAKVWAIIERMIGKTFERGVTAKELATQWGCSVDLVERYTVEASRFLRLIREPELIRARVLARLTEIGEQDENDRVPALLGAAKVAGVLDNKGEGLKPPLPLSLTERNESLRELLRDPPAELVAILEECWGPRTVTQ